MTCGGGRVRMRKGRHEILSKVQSVESSRTLNPLQASRVAQSLRNIATAGGGDKESTKREKERCGLKKWLRVQFTRRSEIMDDGVTA